MNTLTIIVLAIFLICIAIGFWRGLIKSVVKIIFAGVSLLLAYILSPMVSGLLVENTQIDDYFRDRIYSTIEEVIEERVKDELGNSVVGAEPAVVDELVQIALNTELTKNQQIDMLYDIKVPEFVRDALVENNFDEMRQNLGAKSFYDYIAIYIARMIVNAIAFAVTFVVVALVFGIVYLVLTVVVELPVISGINRFGGLIFGIMQSLVIVWLIFALAGLFAQTELGNIINVQIKESPFLTFINNHNIFDVIMKKLVKIS